MLATAQIGIFTRLLELAATSIGAGIVTGSFIAAGAGMLIGRSRKEMEGDALREAFMGGMWECFVCALTCS